MLRAGDNFVCSCCNGTFSEIELRKDVQWGPVCMDCKRILVIAENILEANGLSRPITKDDINDQNRKRFNK